MVAVFILSCVVIVATGIASKFFLSASRIGFILAPLNLLVSLGAQLSRCIIIGTIMQCGFTKADPDSTFTFCFPIVLGAGFLIYDVFYASMLYSIFQFRRSLQANDGRTA